MESIISNLPKEKAPGPAGVNDEFYQTLKRILYNSYNSTQIKIELQRKAIDSFYFSKE